MSSQVSCARPTPCLTLFAALDEGKVYVIGGLVDHNAHKGLTHRLACERGVAHARLPIAEHIDLRTRKVLTVPHVFRILQHFAQHRDWTAALLDAIPPRKGGRARSNSSASSASASDGSDAEDADGAAD